MDIFRFLPGYESAIYETGREPALVLLVAFLITFVLTRGYTRIARVRGWGSAHMGNVHVHHVVVGVVLTLVAGAAEFAYHPTPGAAQLLLAVAFGSGAALVLDEFALVLHLQDVYWAEQGRKSVDAVVTGTTLAALFLLNSVPGQGGQGSRWAISAGVGLNLVLVVVAGLKGKFFMATLGVFVPFLALVAAIRLGEPGSVWARRRYKPASKRLRRTETRYARYEARWRPRKERMWDLIGGTTSRSEHSP